MLRRIASIPVSLVHFGVGSVVLLAQAVLLDRMVDELHR
jgi:hypothetical protein